MSNDKDNFKKKLVYRSQYRGTKEMDKLIGSFVKDVIDQLDIDELKDLEIFLEINDDTLYKIYNNQIIDFKITKSKIGSLFKNFIYKK